MNRVSVTTGVFCGVLVCAMSAWAGPEQDFDAAVKAGRPLSAESAYRALVKSGAKTSPLRHYLAADIAEQCGKMTLRNDRLALYVRSEKGWTPQVEKALWRLVASGTDVDFYTRLSGNTKPTRALWLAGYGMLCRLCDQNRPNEVVRLMGVLMAKFEDKERRARVLYRVWENARGGNNQYPREELKRILGRYGNLADTKAFGYLLTNGNQASVFPRDWPIRYVVKYGGTMPDGLLTRALEAYEGWMPDGAKEAEKLAAMKDGYKRMKKIEKFVFDGKHPYAALKYFRIAGLFAPGEFFAGWKKDAPAPGLAAVYERLVKSEQFAKSPYYRERVLSQRNELEHHKRFDEKELAAFKAADKKLPKPNPEIETLVKTLRETKDANVRRQTFDRLLTLVDANFTEWNHIETACGQLNSNDAWYRFRKRRAELLGTWNECGERLTVEKNADRPLAGIDMKKMSADAAYSYYFNNWRAVGKEGAVRDQLLSEVVRSHPATEFDNSQIQWIVERMLERGYDKAFMATLPLAEMAKALYSGKVPKSWYVNMTLLCAAYRGGQVQAVLPIYTAWAETLEPVDRFAAYANLVTTSTSMPNADGKGFHNEWVLGEKWLETVVGGFARAIAAWPENEIGYLDFNLGIGLWDGVRWARDAAAKPKDKKNPAAGVVDAKRVAAVDAFYDLVTSRVLSGARNSEGNGCETVAWHRQLMQSAEGKNAVMMAKVARRAGSSLSMWYWSGGGDAMRVRCKKLQEAGNDEALYLYVDAVPGDIESGVVAAAAKVRSAIASKLPGIYPVAETDPAYPLYVAADELAKKNPEHAWQILKEPKNQSVFEREALKLPPDFTVWAVEQLRMARGEKDALLLKARQIATAILAQESKVTHDVAAAMILSRAEGYRDQQNFEAAKLEYQSIRDNPAYHNTPYGKKAMFRAIDLQIVSGNVQAVEATLEYWLSQPDREVQAEAHYFQAKIAFDRKDYDECIRQLRQVFAISYTHTEGRFLQGKWKLATNSEVDDTDVLIGDLSERNLIRPGNQLTITVQDANLSVAGGGASIPVIVTAEPGGDLERINLYPTSRDPSNFKGLVEVQLGKACPSNRVLEVRGSDIVSYEIDPAFLKERGLPKNEPRRLKVIDDAKLAIGAGAPRTDEKKTEKGVKNLLQDSDNLEDSGVARKLRPGNPLYIVVQDRDASLGNQEDTVSVTVETSSGDLLQNFVLKEEKPFSGVFRGKVETSLPPPRAFASDTAAGMNPGDVINSGKNNGWKSLSDGQPGKWFEVDTMGSHLFSEISLATPNASDVKTLKLVGRMGSKVMTLAQLPAALEVSKLYLRHQQQYDRHTKTALGAIRAFCQTDKAGKPKIVQEIKFRMLHGHPHWERESAYFHGPFVVPEGVGSLRFRVKPVSASKMALKDLWITFALDGEEVFSGQGCKLQGALIAADITPGCHRFELAVVGARQEDAFDLLWEPEGQEAQPMPADWFSEEKNPVLKQYVKDLAVIVKTPDGFRACFDKPTRLRSFRWEFTDVKSPDVALSRISAKNDKDEPILPVASDFSDSQQNDTLEVAPGDKIIVRYEDERTTSGEKKVLQRDLDSSFNDAKVRFIFEEVVDRSGRVGAFDAFRFVPGDTLVLCVTDPDCDVSDEADKLEVSIRNNAGQVFKKRLTEYRPRWAWNGQGGDAYGMHSGIFMGVIKTCAESNTNAPANVLRVSNEDLLTVSYEDRENTDPGVPFERQARIFASRPATPSLTFFNVRKEREIDRSADAKVLLERIRRRPGNENVEVLYRDILKAEPMDEKALKSDAPVPVNVSAGCIPVRVSDRSRARYACSKIYVEAVAESEVARAAAEGRDPDKVRVPLRLGGSLQPFRLRKGDMSVKEAQAAGVFNGIIQLSLGPVDPNIEVPEDAPPLLCVTGSDTITLSVLDEEGAPLITRKLRLVSDATVTLTDSSLMAERNSAHVGESFFVVVNDADRDATDEPDRIDLVVSSTKTGAKRPLTLTETMPHSGVFSGRLRPVMFAPGETIPSVSTGGVASANEILTEERFAIGYGDKVVFTYDDELTLPGTPAGKICATGTVFRGSNGDVRLFSKRFADRDAAVLVQFRLAECLFEQAKEYRKLKQTEKSAACIDDGKFILEEALKNYPDSSHVVQGEFLLANLYQELANEQKDADNMDKAMPLYQEALSRFSQILGTWPEGEYAARSQYHKALCLEMLKDYNRASEEYVKMTYIYPESELVGEATIRLATYYYTQEKRYDISGHIYRNFQKRFPQHEKASRALFMAGSCYIKQAETINEDVEKRRAEKQPLPNGYQQKIDQCYRDAGATFEKLIEEYKDGAAKLRAQTLYWAGDVCVRRRDYSGAYRYLKQCVFEYPETEWARRARGLLLQEEKALRDFE